MSNKSARNILVCLVPVVIVVMIFIVPLFVSAATEGCNTSTGAGCIIKNPFKCEGEGCTISGLIKAIVNNILIPIGGVVAVMMIMYAGFLYVTAGGNETRIKKAHEALLWGVIGAAILLGAWVISEAIQGTINQLKA